MHEPRALRATDLPSAMGLGDGEHSPSQRFAAVAICIALTGLALLAVRFGSVQGPEIRPFLPIVATVWALADLMTAFLLLAQFYVNGTTFFTALAAAYALNGLLTVPYLFAFPGLFGSGHPSVADQQLSLWMWVIWHATFPVVVSTSVLFDPKLKRQTFSHSIKQNVVWMTILVTIGVATAATALLWAERAALPILVANGHFKPAFSHIVAPAIALLDLFASCVLLKRRATLTTLQLWLFVAIFTATLDALLNATSPGRYSYGWYIGKFETVITSSIVLCILLVEVTGLYRRLAKMATIDALTQLYNRRALEGYTRQVLGLAKRKPLGLGLLVIDVDLFKGYNDTYGHARGDECLRDVAAQLRSVATRPLDFTARYGGEEFVVLVPETPREGAVAVAERICAAVEAANLSYETYARGHVTVSVGVAYVADARRVDAQKLFEIADRALYEAKERGRNCVIAVDYDVASGPARERTARVERQPAGAGTNGT